MFQVAKDDNGKKLRMKSLGDSATEHVPPTKKQKQKSHNDPFQFFLGKKTFTKSSIICYDW